ncbi:hypothetical protein [Streptomyces monomycini]|uniref:hypothetical protein n=1 Tax=Streptomyces monomycini TaxID=371720 RepID=UPI001431DA91|nr:hypothetical protein [Streptomyces monomycini]
MQSRTNAGRRARTTVMVALLVAVLWGGVALTKGAAQADGAAPGGPVGHLSRAVEIIRG